THDTKRSEDVRARLAVLAERPADWASWVSRARTLAAPHRSDRLDASTEYLLWQTLVGAWPIDADRLGAYATKAVREAKLHTTWTEPDAEYEEQVLRFVTGITTDGEIGRHVADWLEATAPLARANILGQKLVQLTMPGIPDVYQGTELVDLFLVDPDNRQLVDHGLRRDRLAHLDSGGRPADLSDEKLLVTTQALRLRRERPEAFIGPDADYTGLTTDSDHLVAFARGARDRPSAIVLASRLTGTRTGRSCGDGWGDSCVELPAGRWRDRLSGTQVEGGSCRVADALPAHALPVALFERIAGDEVDPEGSP
ncbi:MAG: malto-oligosyltrehalose synthase, partial [Micrococcales bacterium]|nr:malto-oligosyltrehalose synthase [Micrococcales bacterium]